MFFLNKFFLVFLFLNVSLFASTVRWYCDFELAHKESLKQKKNMMVLFLKQRDSTFKKLIKDSFVDKPYIDKINKKYISVIVIKNQKSNYPIEMLYTSTYPALFFLDKDELFICEPLKIDITPEKLKTYLGYCR